MKIGNPGVRLHHLRDSRWPCAVENKAIVDHIHHRAQPSGMVGWASGQVRFGWLRAPRRTGGTDEIFRLTQFFAVLCMSFLITPLPGWGGKDVVSSETNYSPYWVDRIRALPA